MGSKTQVTYILTKFSERNTDRHVSSSVEVEKMKSAKLRSRGDSHGGPGDDSQDEGSCENRGVGSHEAIKLLNNESVELIKVTLRSPALTRLWNNR